MAFGIVAKLSVHGLITWDEGAEQGFLYPRPGPEGDICETLSLLFLAKKKGYQTLTYSICAKMRLPTVRSDSCRPYATAYKPVSSFLGAIVMSDLSLGTAETCGRHLGPGRRA